MTDDDIPILTSVVRRAGEPKQAAASELAGQLTAASLDLADRLIHSAFKEMEAAMFEQVSRRLRDELPAVIADILDEHYNQKRPDEDP